MDICVQPCYNVKDFVVFGLDVHNCFIRLWINREKSKN